MNRIELFEGQEIVNRINFNRRLEAINEMADDVDYNKQGVTAHHTRIDDHEARIKRLEDGLFGGVSKYSFLVTFRDLEGIVLNRGVWNESAQRLEC